MLDQTFAYLGFVLIIPRLIIEMIPCRPALPLYHSGVISNPFLDEGAHASRYSMYVRVYHECRIYTALIRNDQDCHASARSNVPSQAHQTWPTLCTFINNSWLFDLRSCALPRLLGPV